MDSNADNGRRARTYDRKRAPLKMLKAIGGPTFVDLPPEIILEILSYFVPVSLVNIARTNGVFRSNLTDFDPLKPITPYFSNVWAQARKNICGLPAPPEGWSEYRWARAVFTNMCDGCGTRKAKCLIPVWTLRKQFCKRCFRNEDLFQHLYNGGFPHGSGILQCVRIVRDPNRRLPRTLYYVPHGEALCMRYFKYAQTHPEQWSEYIEKEKAEKDKRVLHGDLCKKWAEEYAKEGEKLKIKPFR